MADDVSNEVRRILVNNTIEQVISYNATIKKDIQQSHEELRNVVGQRYRELILACDKVVGMEDVCRQVISTFKALEGKKRSQHAAAEPSANAVGTAAPPPEPAATAETALVKDAVLANQLLRRLNSVRALTRAHCFLDGTVGLKAVQGKLADVGRSSLLYSKLFDPIERTAEILFRDMLTSMRKYLVDLGKASAVSGSVAQTIESYRDLHSAIELLHTCSPSHALSILCDLHIEALATLEQLPTASVPLEKQLLTACAIYFNLVWYCHGAPSIPSGLASTAVPMSVSSLQSAKDATLETLSLQVIGLRVLSSQPQSSAASRLDGWALSPATARPELKIDPADIMKVQAKVQATIGHLMTQTSHRSVEELGSLHEKMRTAAESLARRLAGASDSPAQSLFDLKQWNGLVSSAVQEASKQVLTDLVRSCSELFVNALDLASSGLLQVTSSQAHQVPVNLGSLFTEPSSLFQRSTSFSGSSTGPSSPVSPLSPASRKRAFSVDELQGSLHYLSVAVASSNDRPITSLVLSFLAEMVDLVSRRIAKASVEENVVQLLNISSVVACFLSSPMLTNSSTEEFARTAAQFERLYVDSHRLWISKTIAERCAVLLRESGTNYFFWGSTNQLALSTSTSDVAADLRSELSNGWAAHSIEGAVVQYPCRSSPGLGITLLKIQQEIHSAGAATRLGLVVPALQDAILGKFVSHYAELAKRITAEDALLQIAFDIIFIGTAYSQAAVGSSLPTLPRTVQALVAQIEEAVDVVTWSMAFPLLSAAAVNAAATSALCFGFVGRSSKTTNSSASTSAPVDVVVNALAEIDRFPLLPLSTPTQPKPNLSALLSSTSSSAADDKPAITAATRSVKDAASLLAGATKGLRNALWGDN